VTATENKELEVTVEEEDTRRIRLTAEVPGARMEQEMQRAARRIARQTNIPGFRKGKAPYDVIVRRYGEDVVRQEAIEELVEQVYREALEREEILPYAPGTLTETELEPVRFVFDVPLPPVVELGDYRSLRVKPPRVRVTKKEVEEVLEQLRQENAVLEPVQERPAEVGDVAVLKAEGRTGEDQLFMDEEEAELLLDPESDYPVPGFVEAVLGMEVGEERKFSLDMPEDFPFEKGEFEIRLERLFDRILPDIDDDLARTVGNFDSLKELRKTVKEGLLEQKQEAADEEYANEVVQAVTEQSEVSYPQEMLEDNIDTLVQQSASEVQREQRMSLSDYLTAIGKTEEELREELEPRAEERLKRSLVVAKLAAVEDLRVSDEELEEYTTEVSRVWGDRAEEMQEQLHTEENRRFLLNSLLGTKVVNRLVAIASGQAEEESSSEESKEE